MDQSNNIADYKILHIIDSGGLWGAEAVLLNLVEEQLKLGLLPMIASIGALHIAEKPLEVEARNRNLPVKIFRFRPGLNVKGALAIVTFAQKEKFQLLHCHGYKGNILLGLMPERIRRLPVVSTLHGWTSTSGFSKMWINEWLDAFSLQRVDQVVVVNREMLHHPRLQKHAARYKVVDNGIPLEETGMGSIDDTIVEFCKGGTTLCAIGRLSREKGFDLLLEAIPLVMKEYPDIRLVIIGEGRQRDTLQAIIDAHGLNENILMPGYRPQAGFYLRLCRCLVMSSLTEGLPITLLEAMRAGVPVVATRAGGIADVLDDGNCGILIPTGSAAGIAEGVLRLLADKEHCRQRVQRASIKFRQSYSSRTMAERYHQVYCEVLQGTNQ